MSTMKSFSTCLLFMIILIGCRKEVNLNVDSYLRQVHSGLKDSITHSEYAALDFSRTVRTRIDTLSLYYLRIPYKGNGSGKRFLLLQTTGDGRLRRGRKIEISQASNEIENHFNGHVKIHALTGERLLDAPIAAGRIKRANPFAMRAETLQPDSYQMMPEVIVVATRTSESYFTYSYWMNLESFFGDGTSSGYYSPMDDGAIYSGGGGGSTYSGTGTSDYTGETTFVYEDPLLWVDFEDGQRSPEIDVAKFLNCFNSIPDAGSSCSIEIFADIPIDSDPNKLFDLGTQSPGHAFIQIKKSNGSKSVIQNIGFYPRVDWKSIVTTAPVDGKFVNNGGHEFNASIKMNVSPENFKSILTEILYLARFIRYDIDEYNCTDFALDVFNKVRIPKLEIPLYAIPGGITAAGTRTPQGLFNQLRHMKNSGHPESGNITVGNYKNWVANSTGPCN